MVKDGFNISIPGIFLEEDRVRRRLENNGPIFEKVANTVAKPKYLHQRYNRQSKTSTSNFFRNLKITVTNHVLKLLI
jgi:hypothetical protein